MAVQCTPVGTHQVTQEAEEIGALDVLKHHYNRVED